MIPIRKASAGDVPAVASLYEAIHDAEERGETTTGWLRGIYPVEATARAAQERGELYVAEDGAGREILGCAIINQTQVDVYARGNWLHRAPDSEVLVLHTLIIAPRAAGRGLGTAFVGFYEGIARKMGCTVLRMDTNARNLAARRLYRKLGYREADIVPTTFNGIPGVGLVLLEKVLDTGKA